MTKKLSKQQKRRIHANRNDKLEESDGVDSALVIAHMGYQIIAQQNNTLINCDWRKQVGVIAVNDRVLLAHHDDGRSIIEGVFPRGKTLYKWQGRKARAIASNLDQLLIVIAVEPQWQNALIDRYLIAAKEAGINVAILCNKTDLADSEKTTALEEKLAIYAQLGYPIFCVSVEKKRNLEPLLQWLEAKQTIICGQSGVGKSSLISLLIPNADIWIQSISKATGLGRHTTTNLRRYPLTDNACIIDTPGVRGFAITHFTRDNILAGFPEITQHSQYCKFNNCSHTSEPHCGVEQALKNGEISQSRYESLQQLLNELEDKR